MGHENLFLEISFVMFCGCCGFDTVLFTFKKIEFSHPNSLLVQQVNTDCNNQMKYMSFYKTIYESTPNYLDFLDVSIVPGRLSKTYRIDINIF
ncbi:hypothetical protein [Lutimonas sp.]|uniref:hypothetical protein n=1 Tax=Lutimonas sp. TaxID=1872403 RepID=UPI003D9B7E18